MYICIHGRVGWCWYGLSTDKMSRIGIHVSDVFGRVACDNQVLADSTGSRATMNCVLISAENKVVGRAAEILARKTKKNLLRGSDYMSLRNNKECVELFLREMIRTASTAGDKIEAIVLGIPAFRYLGDVEYVKELVSILKTHCDHVQVCPSELLACVSLEMDKENYSGDVAVISLDGDSLRVSEIRVRSCCSRIYRVFSVSY